jgi:O-antigen ligase
MRSELHDHHHPNHLIFVIATMPILFGAVQPWVWSIYCLLMIAVFILRMWTGKDRSMVPRVGPLTISVATFFVFTLVLCLPLPHAALELLSPVRAEILSRAWALTDNAAAKATLSYLPRAAFGGWIFLLSLGLFYHAVRDLCADPKTRQRIVFVMIGVGLLEAAYGLIQALVPSMGVLWVDYVQSYQGTARGTFINRNNFSGFIEMIWPLALGATLAMTGRVRSLKSALYSDSLNRQALMALGIIVFLLALIFTRSRAGIISGLVGFLVFTVMARTGMRTVARQTRLLLGGIVLLLCVYTMTIGFGPVMSRFLSLGSDGNSRLEIWRDSLPIINDHPLGIGLRNYENVFAVYNRSFTSEQTVAHAHNDYLQMLIETGWIGFAAIIGSFLIFIGKSARRIRQIDVRRDSRQFFLAVGAFSGLISMSVHSLFDFNLQIPANCLYFVVLMAVLSACTRPGGTKPKDTAPPEPR